MSDERHVHEHYARGEERARLDAGAGALEFARTTEIVARRLPGPPARVADIGGGPGRYAIWLAERGYDVLHRDLVALHVQQVREGAAEDALAGRIHSAVADARALDLADGSVDAVLLLGPLYHLTERSDRLRALREARRVLRPGGVAFVAVISRWAPRLDGMVVNRLFSLFEGFSEMVEQVERTGVLQPLYPGSFAGYCHRPDDVREEIGEAGLDLEDLVSVEGIGFALADIEDRMAGEPDRAALLESARAIERIPELLGLGPHLMATARRD